MINTGLAYEKEKWQWSVPCVNSILEVFWLISYSGSMSGSDGLRSKSGICHNYLSKPSNARCCAADTDELNGDPHFEKWHLKSWCFVLAHIIKRQSLVLFWVSIWTELGWWDHAGLCLCLKWLIAPNQYAVAVSGTRLSRLLIQGQSSFFLKHQA